METKEPPLYLQILAGLVFFGAGLAIILMVGDVISTDSSEINAPRWVGALAGGLFPTTESIVNQVIILFKKVHKYFICKRFFEYD